MSRSIATIICVLATMIAQQAVAQQSCPTLVVSTNDDVVNGNTSSPCALISSPGADGISLREALLAANNATGTGTITITFASALAGQTITLTERFAPITRSQITLTGPSPNITINASGASNPGPILFIAASLFSMSGFNFSSIPTNFVGMQIGGSGYGLTGQPVTAPLQISGFQITGNAFSSGTGSNTFAIFVPPVSNETISDVIIANNSFSQLFEGINLQGGGPGVSNSVIQAVSIYGNTFSQMTQSATSAVEVGVAGGTNNTVQGVQITQNTFTGNFAGFGIDINGTSSENVVQNVTVAGNVFSGNLQALGITAGVNSTSDNNLVLNTQIVNNVIDLTGFNGAGAATIQITDSQAGGTNDKVTNVSFVNNTIYNGSSVSPPGWGVWVNNNTGGVTGVSIWNTIFWGNESNPPLKSITSSSQVSYSIIDQSGFSGVNNNINSDPLFVNSSGGNFQLQSGSPAIGAGTSVGAPTVDVDCQQRANPPSIGAYEFEGPNACGTLQVSPTTAIAAAGYQAGPFSPSSFNYSVATSTGTASYSISGAPSWLTASVTSGTVTTTPGTVTFTVNASANSLGPGTYGPSTVIFANTTSGLGTQILSATLTVSQGSVLSVSVTGSGTVTSSPSGINCGATCSAGYATGTPVTLSAAPASGWSFNGWGGACSGSGGCTVTMNAAQSVSAAFSQPSYTLSVSVSGSGMVTSSPSGINCGGTCSASFAIGTPVTLTATPAASFSFIGWSGACSGTSCTVTMNASVSASFANGESPSGGTTWVSNVGNDSNACTITAPCLTFAGAVAKTSAGGEINCLTPGSYGAVIISIPVTIDCHDESASIQQGGVDNVLLINAPGAVVTVRNLTLDGLTTATDGLIINAASTVYLEDLTIANFAQNGILDNRTSGGTSLLVKSTTLLNNAGAASVALTGTGTTTVLENVRSVGNTYGVQAVTGNTVVVSRSVMSANTTGVAAASGATVLVDDTEIVGNVTGIISGAAGAMIIANSDIYFNGTGIIGTVYSYGTTRIYGNGSPGTAPIVGPVTSEHGQQ